MSVLSGWYSGAVMDRFVDFFRAVCLKATAGLVSVGLVSVGLMSVGPDRGLAFGSALCARHRVSAVDSLALITRGFLSSCLCKAS